MKITIEVDELEKEEAIEMLNYLDYKLALCDLAEEYRRMYKYEEAESVSIDKLRDMFYQILEDRGIEL